MNRLPASVRSLVLVIAAAAVVVLPLLLVFGGFPEGLKGTDDRASELVGELSPGYEPWYTMEWNRSLVEHQELIFALQGLAGAAILTGAILALRYREKRIRESSDGCRAD